MTLRHELEALKSDCQNFAERLKAVEEKLGMREAAETTIQQPEVQQQDKTDFPCRICNNMLGTIANGFWCGNCRKWYTKQEVQAQIDAGYEQQKERFRCQS